MRSVINPMPPRAFGVVAASLSRAIAPDACPLGEGALGQVSRSPFHARFRQPEILTPQD
jgi:hypothetical protein